MHVKTPQGMVVCEVMIETAANLEDEIKICNAFDNNVSAHR